MKFDMHIKNIRNMKFNGQIFKIYTQKKIYDKFEEKHCSSLILREPNKATKFTDFIKRQVWSWAVNH